MYHSIEEACRLHLYSEETTLRELYPNPVADGVLRVREMYQWLVANPSQPDRAFIEECVYRFDISRPTAYKILRVVKTLLPTISESSKAFHLWRFNEMILATFENAKKRGDARTMERCVADYARYNTVDKEDIMKVPVDEIKVQPFTATDDPSVLGLKRIPNVRRRVQELLEKYTNDSPDIQDVSYEEADLELDVLFKPDPPDPAKFSDS